MEQNEKSYSKVKEFMLYWDRKEIEKEIVKLESEISYLYKKRANKRVFNETELGKLEDLKEVKYKELLDIEDKIKDKVLMVSYGKFFDIDPVYDLDWKQEIENWSGIWDEYVSGLSRKERKYLESGVANYKGLYKEDYVLKDALKNAPDTSNMKAITYKESKQTYDDIEAFYQNKMNKPTFEGESKNKKSTSTGLREEQM